MAISRSPKYPVIGLPDAIDRAKVMFEKEEQNPAPKDVVAKDLGYSGLNGASLRVIAALLVYGLIEKVDEDFRISERAMAIIFPRTPGERAEAIREAALAPQLFRDLFDYFKGSLPSVENLNAHLLRRGFTTSALKNVVSSYRDTMGYLSEEGQQSDDQEEPEEKEKKERPADQAVHGFGSPVRIESSERVQLQAQIGPDTYCRVLVKGPFGHDELELLLDYLRLQAKIIKHQSTPPDEGELDGLD